MFISSMGEWIVKMNSVHRNTVFFFNNNFFRSENGSTGPILLTPLNRDELPMPMEQLAGIALDILSISTMTILNQFSY